MNKPKIFVASPFFWLPFFMFLGTFAQSGGIFNVGIIWCWLYQKKRGLSFTALQKKLLFQIGMIMWGIWLIYPIFDLINSLLPVSDFIMMHNPQEKYFVVQKSQIPSTVPMVATALMFIGKKYKSDTTLSKIPEQMTLFFNGLFKFFVFFSVFFVLQHLTGIHYKAPEYRLAPENLLPTGFYRIFGFYGHTLNFSSVMLIFFAFSMFLLSSHMDFIQKYNKKIAIIFFLSYILMFLAGGRTAIAIATIFILIFLAKYLQKKFKLSAKIIALFTFFNALIAGTLIVKMGILQRVMKTVDAIQSTGNSLEFARITFWKTYIRMFLDSPWIGHGAGRLRVFVKEAYYNGTGLQNFERKYNAHNFYLETITDVGLIGTGILIIACYFFFRNLLKLFSEQSAFLKICLFAWFFAIIINAFHGITQNVFYDANVVNVYMSIFILIIWSINSHQEKTDL